MHLEQIPKNKVSYEKTRDIVNARFNIAFVYRRCDTCSICRELAVKIGIIQQTLQNVTSASDSQINVQLPSKLRMLNFEKEVHLKQAETFYSDIM
ncbi:hypothetical protein PR048_009667 [Dryococelus australis]|uniref:Uncharacterized protein n=1 Tax=Dryococelus australis TaxID=614101 RepID=A0ABQ9I0K7_9NEOP|nr:hypothetical protein PR048_009667 [Dryococelus australis]